MSDRCRGILSERQCILPANDPRHGDIVRGSHVVDLREPSLIDALVSARTALEESKKDTERLDWLQTNHLHLDTPESLDAADLVGAPLEGNLYFSWNQPPASFREAIDAARVSSCPPGDAPNG